MSCAGGSFPWCRTGLQTSPMNQQSALPVQAPTNSPYHLSSCHMIVAVCWVGFPYADADWGTGNSPVRWLWCSWLFNLITYLLTTSLDCSTLLTLTLSRGYLMQLVCSVKMWSICSLLRSAAVGLTTNRPANWSFCMCVYINPQCFACCYN